MTHKLYPKQNCLASGHFILKDNKNVLKFENRFACKLERADVDYTFR